LTDPMQLCDYVDGSKTQGSNMNESLFIHCSAKLNSSHLAAIIWTRASRSYQQDSVIIIIISWFFNLGFDLWRRFRTFVSFDREKV